MKGGGKPGRNFRRRGALERLEKQLFEFKKLGKDKEVTKTRWNKEKTKYTVDSYIRPFNQEVSRLEREIAILKHRT